MRGYTETIEVTLAASGQHGVARAGAHAPGAFVWRGRRYRVTAVLDTWSERTPWWRLAAAAVTPPDLERTMWRVEASPGTCPHTGVFELAQWRESWTRERLSD